MCIYHESTVCLTDLLTCLRDALGDDESHMPHTALRHSHGPKHGLLQYKRKNDDTGVSA